MARKFAKSRLIRSALLCVALTELFGVPAQSQSNPAKPIPNESKPQTSLGTPDSDQSSADDTKANLSTSTTPEEIRQAQIETDTKKLYQLSAELRAEVAKTYKESLSLTVLKKAQELEKLAKNLKAEMNQQVAAAKRQDQ